MARWASECTRPIAAITSSGVRLSCSVRTQFNRSANGVLRRAAAAASSRAGTSGCGIPGGGRCSPCKACSTTVRRPTVEGTAATSTASIAAARL
eukprot:scaffold5143_cov119-Isochrysis_galbana.AAC.27